MALKTQQSYDVDLIMHMFNRDETRTGHRDTTSTGSLSNLHMWMGGGKASSFSALVHVME